MDVVYDTHRVSFLSQNTFRSCNSWKSAWTLETWWSSSSLVPLLTLLPHPPHDPRVTNRSRGPGEAGDTIGSLKQHSIQTITNTTWCHQHSRFMRHQHSWTICGRRSSPGDQVVLQHPWLLCNLWVLEYQLNLETGWHQTEEFSCSSSSLWVWICPCCCCEWFHYY